MPFGTQVNTILREFATSACTVVGQLTAALSLSSYQHRWGETFGFELQASLQTETESSVLSREGGGRG